MAGQTDTSSSSSSSASSSSSKQSPSDFLQKVIGQQVVVRLNNGTDYKGLLACLDDRMNIAMDKTEEFVDGNFVAAYGLALIRGNNVLYISAAPEEDKEV